jgi:hypothetical protein
MSDNVDRRYFPGIIKTIELYYLQHIAEAAASGVLNFYVIQNSGGGFSEVRLESTSPLGDYEPLKFIQEESLDFGGPKPLDLKEVERIEQEIKNDKKKLQDAESDLNTKVSQRNRIIRQYPSIERQRPEDTYQPEYRPMIGSGTYRGRPQRTGIDDESLASRGSVGGAKSGAGRHYQKYLQLTSDIERLEKEVSDLRRSIGDNKKLLSRAKENYINADKERQQAASKGGTTTRDFESTGAASVKVDTQAMVDLRPTSISIDISVRIIQKKMFGRTKGTGQYEPRRSIPISVKVIPMVVKNFNDIYSVIADDMYANKYSSLYKSAARGFMAKAQNWFGGTLRKFLNIATPSEEVNVWRDILLSRKGFTDASSFRSSDRGPKYQKYAAAIVIMSSDDIRHQEQNFFNNPKKMAKLFKLGWNSFAIMNDADQKLIFCSYYENGMCAKIPYNYLFHSLKATDVFKEMEQLSGFTRRVIGNFKRQNLRRINEGLKVQNEVENKINFTFNEYMAIAEGKSDG